MTLGEKQRKFPLLISRLIQHAYDLGYEITFAEAYRTPEQAALNAKTGKGISNSLHTKRLAIDLNLFKNGTYLTDSKAYEFLGVFWESLGTTETKTCWGGRFKSRPDGNHFSIEHEGVK